MRSVDDCEKYGCHVYQNAYDFKPKSQPPEKHITYKLLLNKILVYPVNLPVSVVLSGEYVQVVVDQVVHPFGQTLFGSVSTDG